MALINRAFGDLRGKRLLKLDLWNEALNTRILHWVAGQGADTWGIDLSTVVAKRARSAATEEEASFEIVQGDIRWLPFAEDSFDFVYTMGTIEHIAEYRQAVSEIRRVMKPGGTAIVGVPNKWDPGFRPLFVQLMRMLGGYPYDPEKSFSSSELRRVLEECGLVFCYRSGILTFPGLLRMADLFAYTRGIPTNRLTGAIVRPFEWLETRFPWAGRFGYLLAHVVRKEI
jgi:SAM-dependent methyltransferase